VYYIGWIWILIVGYSIWKSKPAQQMLKKTWPFFLLCLGPALAFNRISTGITLPLGWLYFIPPINELHHPYRIVSFLIPILFFFGIHASRIIPSRIFSVLLILTLVETLVVAPSPWPTNKTSKLSIPEIPITEQGTLLNWPPDGSRVRRTALLAQLKHQKPIFMGVNQNIDKKLFATPLIQSLYHCVSNPRRLAHDRDIPHPPPRIPSKTTNEIFETLSTKWILLHKNILAPKDEVCTQKQLKKQCLSLEETTMFTLCTLNES
jgi:hypothetical protein